jgi:hypothetical protein
MHRHPRARRRAAPARDGGHGHGLESSCESDGARAARCSLRRTEHATFCGELDERVSGGLDRRAGTSGGGHPRKARMAGGVMSHGTLSMRNTTNSASAEGEDGEEKGSMELSWRVWDGVCR